jgi:hypothetical protein
MQEKRSRNALPLRSDPDGNRSHLTDSYRNGRPHRTQLRLLTTAGRRARVGIRQREATRPERPLTEQDFHLVEQRSFSRHTWTKAVDES